MKEINEILDFFQNLNEFIYVADIETHELVYMNKKTLDAYGFTSVEEIKGKPCYEILQKSSILTFRVFQSIFEINSVQL